MTEEPGTERWNWLAEGNAKQARKRVAVDVLLRDESGRVLLVDPTYKSGWDIPGGMSEANESPRHTAEREIYEELALVPNLGRLLSVEWIAPHGPWDDLIAMIFDGGIVSAEESAALRVSDEEIKRYEFFDLEGARNALPRRTEYRLGKAIQALRSSEVDYGEIM